MISYWKWEGMVGNMDQKIHVLHVVGKLNIGGAESRIMDLYRNIDRNEIQFDFMQHTEEKCAYQEEAEQLGGHVYHVPRFRIYNILSYRRSWKAFMQEHPEIKVVHGHMTSTAGIYLPIAKKYGKTYTIAHARSAGVDSGIKGMMTTLLRKNLAKKCDQCFTCSKLAGVAVFGEKAVQNNQVTTIPNAIDVDKFAYDENKRLQIRNSLGLASEHYVIGHVGRFDTVKNHKYMIQIIQKCVEQDDNCRMVFVGDGPLRAEIEQQVREAGLEKYIIFAGKQRNVQDFYQAFDFFILPSFYEGLPGTAIEAQASGLYGILSDTITEEAIVTELMTRQSIQQDAKLWADEILAHKGDNRTSHVAEVRNAGFDVKQQAKRLCDFYVEAVRK